MRHVRVPSRKGLLAASCCQDQLFMLHHVTKMPLNFVDGTPSSNFDIGKAGMSGHCGFEAWETTLPLGIHCSCRCDTLSRPQCHSLTTSGLDLILTQDRDEPPLPVPAVERTLIWFSHLRRHLCLTVGTFALNRVSVFVLYNSRTPSR